jgi:glutathione peroxidase-family protein
MANLHDFEMQAITGEPVALSSLENQVCLVVNVASE